MKVFGRSDTGRQMAGWHRLCWQPMVTKTNNHSPKVRVISKSWIPVLDELVYIGCGQWIVRHRRQMDLTIPWLLPAPSHESSCQLAFGGRRANNRQLLLWELPCTEDSDRKTSALILSGSSPTRGSTRREGEREACLIVEHENNLSSSKVTFE